MASEDDPPVYSVDDLEDDEEDNNLVFDDTSSNNNLNLVTVADQFPTNPRPNPEKPTIERVLFQRLWTDEDEIELLRGFLDFSSQKKGIFSSSSHHLDTAAFYDQIKSKLQLDFNKNQLVEKLRRLKKKYRTAMGKINSGKDCVFKTPHDQATFEISKKIWFEPAPTRIVENDEEHNPDGNFIDFYRNGGGGGVDLNLKGSARPKKRKSAEIPQFNFINQGNNNNNNNMQQAAVAPVGNLMPGLVEETVRSCLTPIFKELVDSAKSNSRGFGGVSPIGFDFGQLGYVFGADTGYMRDDKWRKQHMLELEVYSKRLELVQDQIKLAMEELTKSL